MESGWEVDSIDLADPDGVADASVSYFEDDSAAQESERKNIVIRWCQQDGTTKFVAYHSDGNIVKSSQDPE